jgi:hypothetical protein
MLNIRILLLAASVLGLGAMSTAVASPLPRLDIPPADAFTLVQDGGLCGNWRRECARLYGYRTYRWQQCMAQPQALVDCGRAGYGYRRRGGIAAATGTLNAPGFMAAAPISGVNA